jgi:hypothetical protein
MASDNHVQCRVGQDHRMGYLQRCVLHSDWVELLHFTFQMGSSLGKDGELKSVIQIHKSLVNSDCLRYLRQRRGILDDLGLASKSGSAVGDKFILDMCKWNQ